MFWFSFWSHTRSESQLKGDEARHRELAERHEFVRKDGHGPMSSRGRVVRCEAIHVSIERPKRLPSAAMRTAAPRFHMRIITVASRSWNRDSANAVTAATA